MKQRIAGEKFLPKRFHYKKHAKSWIGSSKLF